MSRERLLIFLGILVMISPFVGLPFNILGWVLPVLGALVLAIGSSYALRSHHAQRAARNLPPPLHE